MARKRTIDPDLWTDDRVQALPTTFAILFYIGTISQADDEGRLEWSARQLLGRVFPLREDVKQRDVEIAMAAIVEHRLVLPYTVNNRVYAAHPAWKKHQYVNRPSKSKIPEPPHIDSPPPSMSDSVNSSVSPTVSLNDSVSPHVPSVSVSESGTVSVEHPSGVAAEAERTPNIEPEKPKRVRPLPTDEQLATWAITAALADEIAPLLNGVMTQAQWKTRNNDFAKGMVQSGATPETVLAAFRRLRRKDGAPYLQLNYLAEAMVAEKASSRSLRIVPNERKRMWWVVDESAPHGYRLAYGYDAEMSGSRSDLAPRSIPADVAEQMLATYRAELAEQGVA